MGLDNGLTLHTREPIEIPAEFSFDSSVEEEPLKYSYEILYFRKCWNIRREVVRALNADYEYCAKAWLTIDEVKKIWWAINEVNHKSAWDNNESIWTWDEIKDRLDRSLLALEWLIGFMREHVGDRTPFYMVEFYDSY